MDISAYLRVSTSTQFKKGYSMVEQKKSINEFLKKEGLCCKRFYEDPGKSGTTMKRTGLKTMLEDAKKGEITHVVVNTTDRLARDVYIGERIFRTLKKYNVQVLSVLEPWANSDSPINTAIRQILGVFNQYETHIIAERLMSGKTQKAKQGGFVGGSNPYGYRFVMTEKGQDLQIDALEAKAVRKIYRLRKKGKSYERIATILNNKEIPPRKGKMWSKSTINKILANPIYKNGTREVGEYAARREDLIIIKI